MNGGGILALDGAFLSVLAREIEQDCLGARVEKIFQPARDCIILALRRKNGGCRLLLSCAAGNARIQKTALTPENPQTPPVFCMLLRKHLNGGKLIGVRQAGLDRVLFLDFEVFSELADRITLSLCLEIMGHNSNLILLGENGRIVDAVRRVGPETSAVRLILPGTTYQLPPAQNKLDLRLCRRDELEAALRQSAQPLSKALLQSCSGLSPIVCRELTFYALRAEDLPADTLSPEQLDRLFFAVGRLKEALKDPVPTAVFETSGRPRDFSFLPLHQYGADVVTRVYDTPGEMLDDFYRERERTERIRQKSGDLFKTVLNITERLERKLANQRVDLEKTRNKERLRQYGDILYANLSSLHKGQQSIRLPNFYQPQEPLVEIALDERLTPAQNAQKYYNEYRKADTAEKKLRELLCAGEEELRYIESVFDALSRAAGESELAAIRAELYEGHYIKRQSDKNRLKSAVPYLQYLSSDGFRILCGRNNLQNDRLTLKEAARNDLWLHTREIPGSHTVIVTQGKPVPERTLYEAACLAAYNSRARQSGKVAVDYTPVRFVRKPAGARPGRVIYTDFKTIVVNPDAEQEKALRQP